VLIYRVPMVTRYPGASAEELWAQLEALPEHLKGEIIDGQLYVQARPRPREARIPPFEVAVVPLHRRWV
jgi:hypothetical protein